jgi:AI-2 transport protein TqsA
VIAVIVLVCLVLILLCLAVYLSLMELVDHSADYLTHLQELYAEFLAWAASRGYDEEYVKEHIPQFPIQDIVLQLAAALYALIPQAVLTLLFTVYMLLDYDEKHIKSPLQSEVDRRVRKYIVFKTVICLVVAVLVMIILAALNVDMWMLFSLLTFLLNYIPNVGSSIATLLPLPVVILDPAQNWVTIILAFVLPASVHLIIGQVLEPKLLGKSFEMSPVSVLAVLAFWGGVWGIVGAFMSVCTETHT